MRHATLTTPIWTSLQQKDTAQKIINQKTLYAAGLGFIPFPVLDTLSIMSIQIWMIGDLAKVYQIPFKRHQVKSFIGAIVGKLGTVGLLKIIPGLGTTLGGSAVSVSAATATYALGRVFMQHFDQGGTLLDFNPDSSRYYFQQLYKKNKLIVQNLKEEEGIRKVFNNKMEMTELESLNQRLQIEEAYHEELHREAEQFIQELHYTLREQEQSYLAVQQKNAAFIDQLEKTNKELVATVALLKQQVEAKEKRRRRLPWF